MSDVYANGNEISAKKDGNKSIASMPDVCLSPPSPPAGPIPVPYPNSSDDSKTTDGSKSVKISGDEVGLKNQSTYKDSNGDEAATKSFGMGVVSHNIQGPLKHAAWSMDVKIEGYNVIRHMDMTTQNHQNPGNVPGIDMGKMKPPGGEPECVELEQEARDSVANHGKGANTGTGKLPRNDALVTASHTSAGGVTTQFKAVQPGSDWVCSDKSNGYSQPHQKTYVTCTDSEYNDNPQGNRDHSECKIMENLFKGGAQPGGTLTMRVNWNNKGKLSNSPCGQCMGSICKTAGECGVKIEICTGKGSNMKKQPAPCRTINHQDGTTSSVWDSSLLT